MPNLITDDVHHSIKRLECILANWDTLADALENTSVYVKGIRVLVYGGLCHNCKFKNLPDWMQKAMFETWPDYSGSENYPVGSIAEYELEYSGNKFQNPQRRYLAEHCLQYLKDYLANE